MRPQEHPPVVAVRIREIERVVHGARGVRFGHIGRGEIVPVVLDLGPGGDREAEIGENLRQLVHHLADRMDRSLRRGRRGQSQIERFGRQPRFQRRRFQHRLAILHRIGDAHAQTLDARRFLLAFFRAHPAKSLHQLADPALLAQRLDADRFDLIDAVGFMQPLQRVGDLLFLFGAHRGARLGGTTKKRHPRICGNGASS